MRLFSQASLQRPNHPSGGVVERVVCTDSGTVELPRGRDHPGACGCADGTKGSFTRQSQETEGAFSKMRRVESRSFGVRVLEGHSPLQGR